MDNFDVNLRFDNFRKYAVQNMSKFKQFNLHKMFH